MYVAYIYNNEIQSILHSYNYAILQTVDLKLKFFPSQPSNLSKLPNQDHCGDFKLHIWAQCKL
jgi:hypothetical protein